MSGGTLPCASAGSTSASPRAFVPASTCAWPGRAKRGWAKDRPATCIYLDLPLAPWEAALGCSLTVATPEGSVQLTVPAGSAVGRQLRLKGKGIPGKPPGDLYALVAIVLPPAVSDNDKEAYRAMAKAFEFDARAHMKG